MNYILLNMNEISHLFINNSPGPNEFGAATVAFASVQWVLNFANAVDTACVIKPNPPHSSSS